MTSYNTLNYIFLNMDNPFLEPLLTLLSQDNQFAKRQRRSKTHTHQTRHNAQRQ